MKQSGPLSGQVALVTGASRGIGKGIAIELGAAGASVYVTGRSTREDPTRPGTVAATAEEIRAAGGRAVPLACDHHDDARVSEVFEQIRKEAGRLDLLVNNATAEMSGMIGKPFWDIPFELWNDVIGVGLRSHYVASALAARMMVPQRSGLIVNVSSHGSREYLMGVIYGVGKAGLEKLTADTAKELRPYNVAVISIWPGMVKSQNRLVNAEQLPDGRVMLFGLDLRHAETPAFPGRGVVALAADPKRMERSGRAFWVAQLAREYGFTDVDGTIPDGEQLHEALKRDAPPFWRQVLGL
jgi:NAD(P)-dependent dehydrogenase (short-subunit alcohol dehydrogenase family)